MSSAATLLSPEQQLEGVQSLDLLQGLALVHPLVLASDRHGQIAWMSEGLAAVCGPTMSFVGASWGDVFPLTPHPERREDTEREGRVLRQQVALTRADGSTIDVDINSFPVEGQGAALIVSIVRPTRADLRPLDKNTESTLAMLDASPQAVVGIDLAGFVAYANHAAGQLTGRPASDLVDKPVAALLPQPAGLCEVAASMAASGSFTGESIEFKRDDGVVVWVSLSVRPWRLSGGEVVGSIAYIQDVTERAQIQQALEATNAELENYVHSVSHDLRSPLVSVLGFSRLLRQDFAHLLGDSGNHFLDRIEQGGRTMEALIQDLLDLSKIGSQPDQRVLVAPRTVLAQIAAELKPRLDEQHVELRLPSDPPLILCDRTRVYQIFSNLIGNAVAHMGKCESPEIRVGISEEAGNTHITVSDNGRGIAHEDHARIFNVFQTLGTRTEGRRSTGIGLAIVDKIAKTRGGRAWVESAPGHGSTFHVTLPHG